MVWALIPVDPSSGEEDKYYIFKKGTYAVGRKGCDIIIHKDKGVSRIHAHIIVDEMSKCSQVRIKDLSKYGTFINKNLTSNKKVHHFSDKQTSLEDGDLLSFGTGNATLRFSHVPLLFYICCAEASQLNHHLQDKVSSIGACLTHVYSEECTHVLVDQHMPLKRDLLDAIVAKKLLLRTSWLEKLKSHQHSMHNKKDQPSSIPDLNFLPLVILFKHICVKKPSADLKLQFVADKSICTEFPDCHSHVPTIMVDGVSVQVSDPKTRENCLGGYTFLLESTYAYNFGDRLQSLLEVSGSRTFWVEDICSSSQALECGESVHLTYVVPGRSVDKFDHLDKLGLLYRVDEMALIRALLSGNLDQSILVSSSVLVSSSCSTDETVVSDSDGENEAATSVTANAITHMEGAQTPAVNKAEISLEAPSYVSKAEVSTYHDANGLEDGQVTPKDDNCLTAIRNKVDEPEYGSSNIVYGQVLVVRDVSVTPTSNFITNKGIINYKRFRKASVQSGNSFNNLVPFSKYPYKEYEFGGGELAESVKEEKKRKKMDAIADEMFNNEKGIQRGLVSGSARGLRSRG